MTSARREHAGGSGRAGSGWAGSGWRLFAAVVVAAGVGLCARDRLAPAPSPASSARDLGVVSPAHPGLGPAHALDALGRDARRREARFRDAATPGATFASTRLTAEEVATAAPEALYAIGGQLFLYRFTRRDGFGDRESAGAAALRRVHRGARGGPDAYACAECHRRGGVAGGGDASDNAFLDGDGDRPDSALERNPPPLHGAGLVELLAKEMTRDLVRLRRRAAEEARARSTSVRVALESKGVSFGFLSVGATGDVDPSEIRGVDRDLVVRPFGHKGHAATLVEVVEDELALHHGMQTERLVRAGDDNRIGSFGVPDPDGDGVTSEITDGQLAALTLFVAMQEVPQTELPLRSDFMALWPAGEARFRELGCASCHVPSLPLESTVYELTLPSGKRVRVDLAEHGGEPRVRRDAEGKVAVHLFSDLRRHVMGPNLREHKSYRGVLASQFLTRPLWGIARSRPYLHDARAPTLEEAILAHSGAAQQARDAYAELDDEGRAPLRIYLMSLTRAPRLTAP